MSIERELRGNWDNVYYPAPEPMVEEAMAPGQQPGDVLVAEAGGGGAAFGVYPGMGKRSQKSNIGEKMIIGAPDFAAGTARGIATSAGGIGGDLQKIGRFAYALAADNQGGSFQEKLQRAAITMEDPTFFPSSEDLSKTGYTIPGTNFTIPPFSPAVPPGTTAFGMTAEERQQAAELGQNVGELAGDPVMLVKGGQMAVKGALKAAETLAPKAGEMIIKSMDKLGSPVQMNLIEPDINYQPGLNVTQGNKIGVESDLRVKVPTENLDLPEKPLLVLETNDKNVNRQIENLDVIFKKFPDPTLNQNAWTQILSYAFKSDEVPVPPYAAIKALESPENLALPLRKLTQGQIDDASAGFKNAAQFKELYTTGNADVVTTGKLFLWSFLSRGVSPYVQEGLFMDAISGIEPFLKQASSGKFDEKDLEGYLNWASTIASKGSGQPGSGAIHNLNAFGKNFLTKLAIPDENNVTGLQKIHDMMSDANMTGPQIRREFAKIGTGVGIDNKVVSFTLLVSGRDDVLVIDRVQLRNLWDDGRFADKNLWDGRSEKRLVKQKDGNEVEKNAQIAGTALSEITYGAKGLLVYETLERALAQQLKDAYKLVGREGDASLGRYHWETWVAGSQQEASHGTIDAIMREAAGKPEPFKGVTAKQGEYGTYDFGAKYGRDESGPYFIYENSKGEPYRFTVPEFRAMLDSMKDPKIGVIPKGFKVSTSGNAPWFERPEVNRGKLDELIATSGTPASDTSAGKQSISTNVESSATNGSRKRANGTTQKRITAGQPGQSSGGTE